MVEPNLVEGHPLGRERALTARMKERDLRMAKQTKVVFILKVKAFGP
jgi:hypothetical protein